MKILYAAKEGGYWLPLNVIHTAEQLKEYCEANRKSEIDTHNRILIDGGGADYVFAAAIMFQDGTIWDDILCDYDVSDRGGFDKLMKEYEDDK